MVTKTLSIFYQVHFIIKAWKGKNVLCFSFDSAINREPSMIYNRAIDEEQHISVLFVFDNIELCELLLLVTIVKINIITVQHHLYKYNIKKYVLKCVKRKHQDYFRFMIFRLKRKLDFIIHSVQLFAIRPFGYNFFCTLNICPNLIGLLDWF